jgi:hypothetical protein
MVFVTIADFAIVRPRCARPGSSPRRGPSRAFSQSSLGAAERQSAHPSPPCLILAGRFEPTAIKVPASTRGATGWIRNFSKTEPEPATEYRSQSTVRLRTPRGRCPASRCPSSGEDSMCLAKVTDEFQLRHPSSCQGIQVDQGSKTTSSAHRFWVSRRPVTHWAHLCAAFDASPLASRLLKKSLASGITL